MGKLTRLRPGHERNIISDDCEGSATDSRRLVVAQFLSYQLKGLNDL